MSFANNMTTFNATTAAATTTTSATAYFLLLLQHLMCANSETGERLAKIKAASASADYFRCLAKEN